MGGEGCSLLGWLEVGLNIDWVDYWAVILYITINVSGLHLDWTVSGCRSQFHSILDIFGSDAGHYTI